jgi:protein involved in polysaccharide export with SLBB domain
MRCPFLFFLIGCLALGACSTNVIRPEERQPQGFQAWTSELPAYRFQPGDEFDVQLIYNPEFSGRYIVAPDGVVQASLVGSVHVLNRTAEEVAADLTQRYAVELRRPELTVIPREFGSELIYVGGEVQRPGVYKLVHRMGVLEGIMEAGGLLDSARIDEVVLLRRNRENRPMLKLLDVRRIIEGKTEADTEDVPLHRYDVVFVPKSSAAEVGSWVDQNIVRILPFTRSFNYTFNHNVAPGT